MKQIETLYDTSIIQQTENTDRRSIERIREIGELHTPLSKGLDESSVFDILIPLAEIDPTYP